MNKYYSTQRPVGLGTYPRDAKVIMIENFDEKTYCPEIEAEAWGLLTTAEPINDADVEAYELTPADAVLWYCVSTSVYDSGKVTAHIVDSKKAVKQPENTGKTYRNRDIYIDWFRSRKEADDYIRETAMA